MLEFALSLAVALQVVTLTATFKVLYEVGGLNQTIENHKQQISKLEKILNSGSRNFEKEKTT